MDNPTGLSSPYVMEDFDRIGIARPEPINVLSIPLPENPRICSDAPFTVIRQNYMWGSSPSMRDLRVNPSVNQRHFSQMHSQKFLAGKDSATLNCQNILSSSDSLVKFSGSSVPRGQCSKKPGSATENGIHKLIEKQRRSDMKRLYTTLASLLPEENMKGKRSIADQIEEAINYINQLQTKIKELAKKRDEITKISDNCTPSLDGRYEEKICRVLPFDIGSEAFPSLRVNSFGLGLEIIMNTFKNQIVFSNLLQVLEEEGLEIVSAAVSTVNDKVFHSIHSKISDIHSFERTTLSQKLWHLIRESTKDG